VKSKLDKWQSRPDFEVVGNPTAISMPMVTGHQQSPEEDLLLVSDLVDHQAPGRNTPEPLIRTPGLVVTPEREARYRPSGEMTSGLLERIAHRAAYAKALRGRERPERTIRLTVAEKELKTRMY